MATRQEVSEFLREFKTALSFGHVHWVQRTDQTRAHLAGLDMTLQEAMDCLQELTPDHYARGPDADDFKPDRQLWVFGFEASGTEAYIKVALQPDPRRKTVVNALIWSFHVADYPMRYPLRPQT